ncbi:MAG: 2-C-methyl-D-erythritol 4-phosphate cytidylyltransferase, partial [Bacillales bacterium]|nr:2-C-methyl-D-erythritol 4-phosphate cytidylyltransferase [Bacillales bacterium]
MRYSAVVVASGSGTRLNLPYNKMFYLFNNKTIIYRSVLPFLEDEECQQVIIVINPKEESIFSNIFNNQKITYTYGGSLRGISVYNGLKLVKERYVLIHDGARPNLKKDLIARIKKGLLNYNSVIPVIKSKDATMQNDKYISDISL